MRVVRTVDDKISAIKEREEDQRNLGKHIDRLLANGHLSQEAASAGCAGRGFCPMIGRGVARFLGISQKVGAVSTKEIEVAVEDARVPAKAKKTEGSEVARAVFGLAASKKKTPQSKLAAAAESMKSRVELLEERAARSKQAARVLMQEGNKNAAMRELRKSKQFEKQALSTQEVMDAIEAQSDMLEQTALQKQVAAAIGATAATLKKEKGLISKAEDAVDAASEIKDLSDDLVQVMAGLAETTSNDFDEADLVEELECMVHEKAAAVVSETATALDGEFVEESLHDENKEMDHAESERLRKTFPSVPKGRYSTEKEGLLQASQ